MVESFSLNGTQVLSGLAPILAIAAGAVLVGKTRHRTLGTAIVTGGAFALLGSNEAGAGWCELTRQCGWFIVGISSVLLAAQCTIPNARPGRS